jgi:hypothetical protein
MIVFVWRVPDKKDIRLSYASRLVPHGYVTLHKGCIPLQKKGVGSSNIENSIRLSAKLIKFECRAEVYRQVGFNPILAQFIRIQKTNYEHARWGKTLQGEKIIEMGCMCKYTNTETILSVKKSMRGRNIAPSLVVIHSAAESNGLNPVWQAGPRKFGMLYHHLRRFGGWIIAGGRGRRIASLLVIRLTSTRRHKLNPMR